MILASHWIGRWKGIPKGVDETHHSGEDWKKSGYQQVSSRATIWAAGIERIQYQEKAGWH